MDVLDILSPNLSVGSDVFLYNVEPFQQFKVLNESHMWSSTGFEPRTTEVKAR